MSGPKESIQLLLSRAMVDVRVELFIRQNVPDIIFLSVFNKKTSEKFNASFNEKPSLKS